MVTRLERLHWVRKTVELSIIIIILLALLWRYLFLDLWNDELYTLEHFVFVPKLITVTDYHVPNNHVFASLLLGVWTQAQGIHGLHDILEVPWNLRLLMLMITAGGVALTYLAGEQTLRYAGLLSALVLCFTIPFLNFSLQVRGYGISMALMAAMLWLVTSRCTWWTLIALTLCSALMAYTIPSNYYPVVAVGAGCGLCFFIYRDKQWLWKATSVVAGLMLSLLMYAPILNEVFNNEYVNSPFPYFRTYILTEFAPKVITGMLGYRYVLAGAVLIGLVALVILQRRHRPVTALAIIAGSAFMLPFVFAFIRGDDPPHRAFVVVAPVLAMLSGISIASMVHSMRHLRRFWFILPLLIGAEGLYSVVRSHANNEAACLKGIRHDWRPQDHVTNYFQYRYEPLRSVRNFHRDYGSPYVLIHHCEPHDIRHYLDHYGMPHENFEMIDSLLAAGDPFYCVSSHPWLLFYEIEKRRPEASADWLYEHRLTYHNFFLVKPESDR